jgi:hypothetical protein
MNAKAGRRVSGRNFAVTTTKTVFGMSLRIANVLQLGHGDGEMFREPDAKERTDQI